LTFNEPIRRQGRGDVKAHEHDGGDISGEIVASVIKVELLLGGTVTGEEIIIAGGVDGIVRSDNFVLGSTGWRILGDGNAEFNDVTIRGTIFATAGEIDGLTITGTLTLATGGVFRTAASGTRLELSQVTGTDRLTFYDDGATNVGEILVFSRALRLRPPHNATANLAQITLDGDLAQITLSVEGFLAAKIGRTGTVPFLGLPGTGTGSPLLKAAVGGAATPPYTYTGDEDLGIRRSASNQMGFVATGVQRFTIDATGLLGAVADSPHLRSAAGTVSNPAFAFSGDADSGLYRESANIWALASGGSLSVRGSSTNVFLTAAKDNTTGSAANTLIQASDGRIFRSTSLRAHKSRITYNVDYLADIELKPTKFYRKDDHRWYYGFGAEDMADADPLLGDYDLEDGKLTNYDLRAVVTVLAAKVNRLEALLSEAA